MTRLNRRIKDDIIDNAVIKAGIPGRKEALITRRAEWAERVRIAAIGGEEMDKKIQSIKKRFENAVKEVPDSVLENKVFRTDFDIYLNVAGARFRAYFNGKGNYRGDQVYRITPDDFTIKADDPLAKEFSDIEAEESAISEEESTIRVNVEGALSEVTTVKKLLEVWPEVKELLPSDLSPVKKQLPAVKSSDLNKLIGLPSEG
jgi:hypothetical protein